MMDLGTGLLLPNRKTSFKSVRKCLRKGRSMSRKQQFWCQRRKRLNNTNRRIMELKAEMEGISQEQKRVKEGQEEVREKLIKLGAECDQLRKETEFIFKQRAETQLRLNLIFEILKAKKDCNPSKVTNLIMHLRGLTGKQSETQ
ncbi:hypothetical protein SLEP1_g44254 [Rubroshorea leprosula]|uniref:Uncharacterized protein n=1 Tax=Rubroshorea leprosula TaxID=152421 RepID=A0AAV5LGQ2_9ROSI|nr:hypothetical protein SLEP1_g44254 [Rubroshorea leprosula]